MTIWTSTIVGRIFGFLWYPGDEDCNHFQTTPHHYSRGGRDLGFPKSAFSINGPLNRSCCNPARLHLEWEERVFRNSKKAMTSAGPKVRNGCRNRARKFWRFQWTIKCTWGLQIIVEIHFWTVFTTFHLQLHLIFCESMLFLHELFCLTIVFTMHAMEGHIQSIFILTCVVYWKQAYLSHRCFCSDTLM